MSPPPRPQVSPRLLPCHSFSGISLGKTREAGGVRPKRGKEKGQGRTGGSLGLWGENQSRVEVRWRRISVGKDSPHPPNPEVGPEGRQGGGSGSEARRPPLGTQERGMGGTEAAGVRRGWGAGARLGRRGGSPVPLPQPGPGPLADSAPRRRSPLPGLTVREAAPAEAAGRGTGGRGAAAEAAAPAGGSGARGPKRGRRGLRLQRTGTAGEESTAQARCGHRCQSERGGARAPAVSKATGRRGKDSPNLHLVLATAAGGEGGWETSRTVPLHCHSNKEKKPLHKFMVVPRERSYLVTMATGNSPFLFP